MSAVEQLDSTRPGSFWDEAGCRDLPADWFHPGRGESIREARAVCAACPVRPACLHWAITHNEKVGVWGGTSERERRRIRRRLAKGGPVPELTTEWIPTDRTGRPAVLAPPTPEEPEVDLAIATPEATTTNGTGPPLDPATGRPTDVCVNCGKRYTPKRRDQRFHTKECARAWYASHPRGVDGQRTPRIRKARATAKRPTSGVVGAAVPPSTPSPAAGPVDVQALLGQLLATCDRWAIEADLGDIRVSVTRGRR